MTYPKTNIQATRFVEDREMVSRHFVKKKEEEDKEEGNQYKFEVKVPTQSIKRR